MDFKKGGVAAVRVERPNAELLVLLRPRELESLALSDGGYAGSSRTSRTASSESQIAVWQPNASQRAERRPSRAQRAPDQHPDRLRGQEPNQS